MDKANLQITTVAGKERKGRLTRLSIHVLRETQMLGYSYRHERRAKRQSKVLS
jgi:hypothetical protein